jgi:ribose transport system permease protein
VSTPTSSNTTIPPQRGRLVRMTERYPSVWTALVLVIIVAVLTIIAPAFFSRGTWLAVSVAAVPILLGALGQTMVIATGGIDLSIGAVISLSGMTSGWTMALMAKGGQGPIAVIVAGAIVAIATGLAAGTVNGLVVTRMKVEPLITTLGMMGAAQGLSYLIGGGNPIGGLPSQLNLIGFTNVGGWIPVPVLMVAVLALVFWYVLAKTRFGRRTLAIGSNSQAAERAGIATRWHLGRVYALAGVMGAIAGFLLETRLTVAAPTAGLGVELSSITAAVIGGAALAGGRASILGTVIGTLVIAVLNSGLVIAGVDPFWQQVAIGLILVVAVWIDRKRGSFVSRSLQRPVRTTASQSPTPKGSTP